MSKLIQALALAARGFYVFPLLVNSKDTPLIKDYPNKASRDPEQIRRWFDGADHNIAISTTKFGDDQALCVVDIDQKGGKRGDQTLIKLELEGYEFPTTCEHATPNNGTHLIYVCSAALRQGVDVLGDGLDIRSRGGYIVAPGSVLDGRPYLQVNGHGTLAPAPAWLVDRLGADRRDRTAPRPALDGVDPERARDRALDYLKTAPLAVEGQAGDLTTFKVAAHLKDLGCDANHAYAYMAEHWNDRCSPPWELDALGDKIDHAYKYGQSPQGSAAPEAVFPALPDAPPPDAPPNVHPFAAMNQEYAFVKQGAFILHETTDSRGLYTTQHLSLAEFHAWHANRLFPQGNKMKPISMVWMARTERREYEGVVFMPEQDSGTRFFNLWRGFTVQPANSSEHPAVAMFLEHAFKNVCNSDPKLFNWLMGYFAHMIQRPWEKPLTALVFKGGKGVGKNACIERVGALLGPHFLVADDDRYLLGNFNSHLEANLCFTLDEAAWAGDKRAEGRLKGLITGQQHNIERKGKEPYQVTNLTRVIILGNEDWLVPASQDERRYAVFSVGEGRKQDRAFFVGMREGMEQGGYACLLRFFLDFDLSTVDVNEAPNTAGLVQQKIASLGPLQEWWFDCLQSGQIAGGDFAGEMPERVATNRLRDAYRRWCQGRNLRVRLETEDAFGYHLKKIAPSILKKRRTKAKVEPGETTNDYIFPELAVMRGDFEKVLGGSVTWD